MPLTNRLEDVFVGDMLVLWSPELRIAGHVQSYSNDSITLGFRDPKSVLRKAQSLSKEHTSNHQWSYPLEDFDSYEKIREAQLPRDRRQINVGDLILLLKYHTDRTAEKVVGYVAETDVQYVTLGQSDPIIESTVSHHLIASPQTDEITRIFTLKQKYRDMPQTERFKIDEYPFLYLLSEHRPVGDSRVEIGIRRHRRPNLEVLAGFLNPGFRGK